MGRSPREGVCTKPRIAYVVATSRVRSAVTRQHTRDGTEEMDPAAGEQQHRTRSTPAISAGTTTKHGEDWYAPIRSGCLSHGARRAGRFAGASDGVRPFPNVEGY